ncbi:aspartate aminotransferase family protein [bacterium]|nr:aspartate aminotransferase family protein [bacterium]
MREGLKAIDAWKDTFAPFEPSSLLAVEPQTVSTVLSELATRLQDNYPFFHPHYAGQMLKPPHPVAMAAYHMAMQINPNNHALDGGPATAAMEREAVAELARMFGYAEHLGHLTSSGTIANLEALWVARCLHPDKAVAFSRQSHYTHQRMCEVLGIRGVAIEVDDRGRLSLDDLRAKMQHEPIGTVVATLGTTGLGAVDPLDELIPFAKEAGLRVHVDAAYGGFYRLLAELTPSPVPAAPFRAIAQADSIVVDPHKHGLQPYGCGCVLFKDPSVGVLYRHDSPYTYFTSAELHLGEISLECSRAGAAAAALWATMRCLPFAPEAGLGLSLQASRRAALAWAELLTDSTALHLVMPPELDIVTFFPTGGGWSASAISQEADRIFRTLMEAPEAPIFLAKLQLPKSLVAPRAPELVWDQDTVTVLRSCLMKPEHEHIVPELHRRVEEAARVPSRR